MSSSVLSAVYAVQSRLQSAADASFVIEALLNRKIGGRNRQEWLDHSSREQGKLVTVSEYRSAKVCGFNDASPGIRSHMTIPEISHTPLMGDDTYCRW